MLTEKTNGHWETIKETNCADCNLDLQTRKRKPRSTLDSRFQNSETGSVLSANILRIESDARDHNLTNILGRKRKKSGRIRIRFANSNCKIEITFEHQADQSGDKVGDPREQFVNEEGRTR